jgi:hypothetical protein
MADSTPTITLIKQEEEQPSGGWNHPATPLPPTIHNALDDIYWSFCQDPYYTTHLHAQQNNNYFPGIGSANRGQQYLNQPCNCGMKHNLELDTVIKAKYLNIQKAYRAWGRGKHICYDCGFRVNMDGHKESYSAANNIRSSPSDSEMNRVPVPASEDRHHDYEEYLRMGHDEVAEGQEGMIFNKHKSPDILVPTIPIPEGVTVNLSLSQ